MRKITYCNWLGYVSLRLRFRRRCAIKGVEYVEKYRSPNRYLYCRIYRAVLVRRGFSWQKQLPVYESSFCERKKCGFKGTCAKCMFNLNKNVE